MPEVRPFTGLLYSPAAAGSIDAVTAPPYDTITPMDQDRFYRASPYNVVRLILGKDEAGDHHSANKYTRAASHFRSWRERRILVSTPGPSIFPYELRFRHGGRDRRVRGVIAEVTLEPWGGSIIPHERTMPGPMHDRLTLLRTVQANLSPIYGVYAGPARELSGFLDRTATAHPQREVVDDAGTRHRLWIASDGTDVLAEALRRETLMIADGHHRYTVALAYREEMRAQFGPGPWDSVMMLVVDAGVEDPPVLPIHRLVSGPVPPPEPGTARVRDLAEVLATVNDDDLLYGRVDLEQDQLVHRVAHLGGRPPTVCALHEAILDSLAEESLRFVPDAVAAEAAIERGEATSAFILPATSVERVRAVIAAGSRLPQKSTYFWPKPRTGMVIRPLNPNDRYPASSPPLPRPR
jgi:uncharacterized protein (DUF1015 family)